MHSLACALPLTRLISWAHGVQAATLNALAVGALGLQQYLCPPLSTENGFAIPIHPEARTADCRLPRYAAPRCSHHGQRVPLPLLGAKCSARRPHGKPTALATAAARRCARASERSLVPRLVPRAPFLRQPSPRRPRRVPREVRLRLGAVGEPLSHPADDPADGRAPALRQELRCLLCVYT